MFKNWRRDQFVEYLPYHFRSNRPVRLTGGLSIAWKLKNPVEIKMKKQSVGNEEGFHALLPKHMSSWSKISTACIILRMIVGAWSKTMTAESRNKRAVAERAETLQTQWSKGTGTGRRNREWAVRPPGKSSAAMPDMLTANAIFPCIRV